MPFSSEILAALDLEAEPAAALGPDGKVQLGRTGVPLPLVDGEAGSVAGLDGVKDAGLGPAHGVGAPVRGELVGLGNHLSFSWGDLVPWGWCLRVRRSRGAGPPGVPGARGYG